MRYFVIFSFWFLVFTLWFFPAKAETYLRDVPEGHYAYDAVYELIRRGVTGGYPDGTFRGKNPLSRYEIASFLTKLAKSFNVQRGKEEKLIEELKSELSLIQYQAEKEAKETQFSGVFQARARGWKEVGGRADYRLTAQLTRNFNDVASLKIGLDTMDGGYANGQRNFASELLDFEGKVKLGAGTLRVTSGPGDVNHVDDGFFPGENNMKYRRLRRTVSFSSTVGHTDFSLEHLVRSTNLSGLVTIEEYSFKISQNYSCWRLTLNPRIFQDLAGQRDNRLDLLAEFNPTKSFYASVFLGIAKYNECPHGLYVRGEVAYAHWIKLLMQRIGSQYREKFSYSVFDLFNRNLADGATSLGIEFENPLSQEWVVHLKGDYTNPGEAVTNEIHLGKWLSPTSVLKLIYQSYRSQLCFSRLLGLMAEVKL